MEKNLLKTLFHITHQYLTHYINIWLKQTSSHYCYNYKLIQRICIIWLTQFASSSPHTHSINTTRQLTNSQWALSNIWMNSSAQINNNTELLSLTILFIRLIWSRFSSLTQSTINPLAFFLSFQLLSTSVGRKNFSDHQPKIFNQGSHQNTKISSTTWGMQRNSHENP